MDVDGTYFLTKFPSFRCFDGNWWDIFGLVLLAVFLYTLGIPAALIAWLFKNKKKLHAPYFRERFGGLYTHFKDEFYWFNAVVFLRKFLIVVPVIFSFGGIWDAIFASFVLILSTFYFYAYQVILAFLND